MKVLNAKEVGFDYPNSVYCGRPSKFGNPFRTGIDGTRNQVIDKYEKYLLNNPELLEAVKEELKGKNLICWCSPQRCHCDILLRIANQNTLSDFF